MLLGLLKFIITIAGSELGKEAIRYGAEKLVASTDNGIDDEIVDIFLDKAVTSKRNNLTIAIKNKLISKL